MENKFYTYIGWRLDTYEPFYVGKGKGNRWKDLDRGKYNKHFVNIVNKHKVAIEIVADNLTEEQAHDIECWLINELVFKYGFSIDIEGNRSNDHYCHLVNKTWGGEGVSGRRLSEEERVKASERMKGKYSGEKNPMFGKNSLDYMTEEAIEERNRKISEANKGSNPLKNMTEEAIEEWKRKISEANSGENNARAKKVICVTTGQIFNTIKDAGEFYNLKPNNICVCCRNEKNNYIGHLEDGTKLVWMYLEDYENATKEEIENKMKKVKDFKILCVTTGKIFNTVREAGEYYGIKCKNDIRKVCRGKRNYCGKLPDGTPLVWKFID